MKINDFLSKSIKWNATGDAEFPYNSTLDGKSLRIRLNDFPAESLYTLIVGGGEFDFEEWPSVWAKTAKRKATKTRRTSRGELVKAV